MAGTSKVNRSTVAKLAAKAVAGIAKATDREAALADAYAKAGIDPTEYEAIRAAVAVGSSLVGYEKANGVRGLGGSARSPFYAAELDLDPSLAVAPTPSALAAARVAGRAFDGSGPGLRFERLAVYAGLDSVTKARRLAESAGVASTDYVGRGRRYSRDAGKATTPKASKALAAKAAKANRVTPK